MNWTFCILSVVMTASHTLGMDNPTKDLEAFQGTWAVESITRNGQPTPEDQAQRLILIVKGNERLVMDGDDIKSKATFSVDSTKTPKTIDVTVSDGPLAGKKLRGIYEFKDELLLICLLLEGDGRPDDLTSKEGSNRLLQVYKKSNARGTPTVKEPDLRTELLARKTADQAGRIKLINLIRKNGGKVEGEAKEEFEAIAIDLHRTDEKNTAWLKEVVKKHGWPGFTLVGKDGAESAFVLAQHAGQDTDFQKKCLELLSKAVKLNDAKPSNLAYLTDRVRVASGEKQVYGTEIVEKEGTVTAAAIEDEAGVDERRKSVGLPPLAESIRAARRDRGLPDK